jgi:hypothetical protein
VLLPVAQAIPSIFAALEEEKKAKASLAALNVDEPVDVDKDSSYAPSSVVKRPKKEEVGVRL